MVAVLPTPQAKIQHDAASVVKMNAILTALRQYQAANGVLPCPADPTLAMGDNNWGRAAANPGTGSPGNCTGGMPSAAYADATNHIALGMVPVFTLGLSADHALDGYGRDITYAVDTNATAFSFSSPLCSAQALPGAITVIDNGNVHNTVVALVSHGQDGYGAWLPLAGSSGTASRFNSGSTDTSQADNAQVQHGGGLTANGAGQFQSFVNKIATSTFDDHVVYNSTQFNMNAIPQSFISSSAYTTACTPPCTPVSGYSYCRQITIDYTKVGQVTQVDLSNFPLLFAGTYSWLATTGNGGNVTSTNGYDVVFTSDSAGTTLLNFEQESYNSTTGAVNYWIKVPALSHNTNTNIYISYGNASVTTDQSNKTAVWTVGNNYQGVWHYGSGVNNAGPNFAAVPVDSSGTNSAANNGGAANYRYTGSPASVTSPFGVGTGVNFTNGNMDFGLNGTYQYFQNSSTFTIEFWVDKTVSSTSQHNDWGVDACDLVDLVNICSWGVMLTSNASNGNHYGTNDCPSFLVNSSGKVNYQISATGGNCLTIGNWTHIVATRNGSTNTLYVNGVQAAQGTSAPTTLSNSGFNVVFWTMNDSGGDVDKGAYMDELRLSPTAYSADWINTEYNNQAWPDKAGTGVSGTTATSGFYTVGSATSR